SCGSSSHHISAFSACAARRRYCHRRDAYVEAIPQRATFLTQSRHSFPASCGEASKGRRYHSPWMESSSRTDKLAASPQLFESDFLNFFSRVHPSIPAIVFVPVIVAMEWLGAGRGYAAW